MEQEKSTKWFTWSLLLLTGGFAVAMAMISVLMNAMIEEFSLTGADQGMMNSMINVGNTVAVVSTLVLRWRFKKTTMLVISGSMMAVMMAFTGLTASYASLLAVCAVLGVSFGWTDSYANSCIIDANPQSSAKYAGALHGWYGVGSLLTPLMIQALLAYQRWRGVYLLLAPVVLLCVVMYVITLRATQKHIHIARIEAPRFTGSEMLKYVKDKQNRLLLLSCLTYSMLMVAQFAWIVRYMSVQHGAEALGMTCITAIWICATVSRFVAPRLRLSSAKLHTYGVLSSAVVMAAGVLSNNAWVMFVAMGLVGLLSGHCMPVLISQSVLNYSGHSQLPTSAMLLTTRIAGMCVPPLIGAVAGLSMQASMLVPVGAGLLSGVFGIMMIRAHTK